MDSRVHGNDGWGYGGGVLSFYVRVPLLMCIVSSFFCLLASFYLSVRHPRERGDPSYSQCCSSVLPLHCQCYCQFGSMLLSGVSAFSNVTSGACG
ncbi:hypothetical protein QTG66_001604 [Vibrio vulnificus]|nr:hypothetical protein [Vibrio vulnificus]